MTGPTAVLLPDPVWPMESVAVLDDRMNLLAFSTVNSNGLAALASHFQPPDPVSDVCHTVATVTAPSPPVNVPAVVVSELPTCGVPLTTGAFFFTGGAAGGGPAGEKLHSPGT